MKKYIDPSKIRLTAVGTVDDMGDILVSVRDVKKAIEQTPAADVVPRAEIEKIFAELESVLTRFEYPSLTALGNIKVITAEGWHIRADDYRTIKKKYTGELK